MLNTRLRQRFPQDTQSVLTLVAMLALFNVRWDKVTEREMLWIVIGSLYFVTLTVSGFIHVAKKWRGAATIHATLMLMIAAIGIFKGLAILSSSPGPDNAVSGMVNLFGLVVLLLGAVAAICGVAVLRPILTR